MGLRFRKSSKIAPGVKLNVGKKSVGVSVGVKGAHISVNSSGRKSATVSAPGTGLSYTANLNSKKTRRSQSQYASALQNACASSEFGAITYRAKPTPKAPWYRSYGTYFGLGVFLIVTGALVGASEVGIGLALLGVALSIVGAKGYSISKNTPEERDPIKNAPAIPIRQIQNVLLPSETGKVQWQQLVDAAQTSVSHWLRIADDSCRLIDETCNPKVFFERYDLLLDCLQKLSVAENVVDIPDFPVQMFQSVKAEKEQKISEFVSRSYTQMEEKAASLKTDRGKRNRKIKYYKSLITYENMRPYILPLMKADEITEEDLEAE